LRYIRKRRSAKDGSPGPRPLLHGRAAIAVSYAETSKRKTEKLPPSGTPVGRGRRQAAGARILSSTMLFPNRNQDSFVKILPGRQKRFLLWA
jgi:hypothetical protein